MARYRKKLDYRSILAIAAAVVALIAFLLFLTLFLRGERDEFLDISVFYYNNEWIAEPYRVRLGTHTELTENILERLQRLPEQIPGARGLPRGLDAESVMDGKTCVVILSEAYDALSLSDRGIALASMVYTLTELEFVNDVFVVVDGAPLGLYRRDNLLLASELLPERVSQRTYRLYFADPALSRLVHTEREIVVQPNRPPENQLIEELILGPPAGDYRRLIPADVRLRGNITLDGGICYVDFANDFLTRIDSEETVLLTVNSIVNTIIDNTNALQVQLLFAGENTAVESELIDLGKPLSRE